jgi:uncharacterized repeat protein (TIGR03803 family)
MKTSIKNLILLPVLFACLSLLMAGPVAAQTFKTLHSFTATSGSASVNSDGAVPDAALILSGNTLYGTANAGGTSGVGTVFKVNTDGTGFTNLHSFTAGVRTNSDGSGPVADLILSGDTLYGTAGWGGTGGGGTVFAVNTDGTGFTTLHSFAALDNVLGSPNSDGVIPRGGLVLSGNTLYGTASWGGTGGSGTVFAVNTDGTGFTNLHGFSGGDDGGGPASRLILSGNTLYGTAEGGSTGGSGTVFAVNTDGTGFTTLYSFTATAGERYNSEGAYPNGLVLSGNTLYGPAAQGSSSGNGTVFALNTDGTGFTVLYSFAAIAGYNNYSDPTNSDGGDPMGLILSGNTLYGAAGVGGGSGNGTIFKVNTDGTGFALLHSFTATPLPLNDANSDGRGPNGVILSGNTLYGTAGAGGSHGNGTVFSLSLGSVTPPQLTLTPSEPNVILTWPTNATGFTLQSTTNFGSSAVWTTNTPAPVMVNDQNVVTHPISGTQQFFRLSQ